MMLITPKHLRTGQTVLHADIERLGAKGGGVSGRGGGGGEGDQEGGPAWTPQY